MSHQNLFDGKIELSPQTDLTEATVSLPASPGVFLLVGPQDQPVLLLYGANVRSLVRRRLAQEDTDEKTRRTALRPVTAGVWFRRTWSAFETQFAHFQIAQAVYPDSWREFFPRLSAWLLTIDLRGDYPVFCLTDRIEPERLGWGPFPTRASAARCLEILQNVFDLCRCPEILAQAPNAAGCAYAQMNRCAAYCQGKATPQQYRRIVEEAMTFLDDPQTVITALQDKMKQAAGSRAYELAQQYKHKITEAQKFLTPTYHWVTPLHRFYVFAFQPGPPLKLPDQRALQPSVSAFIIGPGRVTQIEPFALADALEGCRGLGDQLHLVRLQDWQTDSSRCQPELFAWAVNFLYKKNTDKGLYIPAEEHFDPDDMARRITEYFGRQKKPSKKIQLDTSSLTDHDE